MNSQALLVCIALPARYAVCIQIAADMLFDLSIGWVKVFDMSSQVLLVSIALPARYAVCIQIVADMLFVSIGSVIVFDVSSYTAFLCIFLPTFLPTLERPTADKGVLILLGLIETFYYID
jgi:hypothetical protein